jgi:hypothetical protein
VPQYGDQVIAATGDNRFVLAWKQSTLQPGGWVDDLYYTVHNTAGGTVAPITQLTNDTAGNTSGNIEPALAALSGNRAFLSWVRRLSGNDDVHYVVVDSNGGLVKGETDLSADDGSEFTDWRNYDAVQLSDGKILAVWEGWGCFLGEWAPRVRFALLDAAYNAMGAPTCLGPKSAAALYGDGEASVTADADSHAIITWRDSTYTSVSYSRHLYYALVNSSGDVLTQPMIFKAANGLSPFLTVNFNGYGISTYSSTLPAGVDAWVESETLNPTPADGVGAVPVWAGNHGLTTATGVTLTATLDISATYAGDTSGIAPVVVDNTVTWMLPDLDWLDQRGFNLFVDIPDAAPGTLFPVSFVIGSGAADETPADNSATGNVWVALALFLPLVTR